MLKMYKMAAKENGVKLNMRNIMQQKKRNVQSGKIDLSNVDMDLNPNKHPSLHPKERPFETYLDEI
jgi:hypothetical protein